MTKERSFPTFVLDVLTTSAISSHPSVYIEVDLREDEMEAMKRYLE